VSEPVGADTDVGVGECEDIDVVGDSVVGVQLVMDFLAAGLRLAGDENPDVLGP